MKLSQLKTDIDKKEKGVWVEIGADGFSVLIAALGNTEGKKMTARLMKPHRKAAKRDLVPVEIQQEITRKVIAKHTILDWKGLEDDNGKKIKYTYEKALEIISNPEFEIIYDRIVEVAMDQSTFMVISDEDDTKN